MTDNLKDLAVKALSHFKTVSEPVSCEPYGNGHINSTFLVVCSGENNNLKRYIFQRVNTSIFKNPNDLLENIKKVITFLNQKVNDGRSVMSIVKTTDDDICYLDELGNTWRMYDFVENSYCFDLPETLDEFKQCGVAFGRFQNLLNDFPANELYEVIPDFHNTPKRYETFVRSCKNDVVKRADSVKAEIEFVNARKDFYSVLYDAYNSNRLPLRVTHNDTKCNNVLLDKDTKKALCVIDLDTIMPGFSVNDFGDSIRFGANTAAEDEKDRSKVSLDIKMFKTYVEGYLEGCDNKLTNEEIMLLPEGAKMMTIECGMRFLTDYLDGDTYFKIKYDDHNLVRARTQFKLVEDMEKKWNQMKDIVSKYVK